MKEGVAILYQRCPFQSGREYMTFEGIHGRGQEHLCVESSQVLLEFYCSIIFVNVQRFEIFQEQRSHDYFGERVTCLLWLGIWIRVFW